jgi:hypothetical protein
MRLFLLAIFSLTFSTALATVKVQKEFRYTDAGMDGFSKNYYSCDFAEDALEQHLVQLGATDIKVRCSGGIEHNWTSPISLRASFANFESADGRYASSRTEVLSTRNSGDACYFHTKLLDKLLTLFPNVRVDEKSNSCMNSHSRWQYVLSIGQ